LLLTRRAERFPAMTDVERTTILLCAAPDMHPEFARIYSYLHDDRARRHVSIELIGRLFGLPARRVADLLPELGGTGRLRRYGLLIPVGPGEPAARQPLALGPDVLAFLCGENLSPLMWFDPAEVVAGSPAIDAEQLEELTKYGVRRGVPWVVGLWGLDAARREAAAVVLAK